MRVKAGLFLKANNCVLKHRSQHIIKYLSSHYFELLINKPISPVTFVFILSYMAGKAVNLSYTLDTTATLSFLSDTVFKVCLFHNLLDIPHTGSLMLYNS